MSELTPPGFVVDHPLWTASADGQMLVDGDGRIVATNDRFDRMFGYPAGALVGRSVEELVPAGTREGHAALREGYESDRQARSMGASRMLEAQAKGGATFPVAISLSPVVDPDGETGRSLTIATVRDLTDRLQLESERAAAQRQRALAEDHDRIASELHDTVIQQLFALGLRLQSLPARITEVESAQRVTEAVHTIDGIIAEIRATIHDLRLPVPADRLLRNQILAVVSDMEDALPQAPELVLVGSLDAVRDGAVIDNLLPTLREALANVGKHAAASSVAVRVEVGETVRLEVRDDGVGLPSSVERSGLANLEGRALGLGGSFSATAAENGGTVVVWEVPRPAEADLGT